MTFTIGLTGGICSGKSTVAKHFANLGAGVICADTIAKQLLEINQVAYHAVRERYGDSILDEKKAINRPMLMATILNNPVEKQWLENLLHPPIRQQIDQAIHQTTTPYAIIEIPLLYEARQSGQYEALNRVLVIDCPKDLQIERLITRNHITEKEALSRINAQVNNTQRLSMADDVLSNTGNLTDLKQHVAYLHQKYLRLSE